jgi:hypothetical protein
VAGATRKLSSSGVGSFMDTFASLNSIYSLGLNHDSFMTDLFEGEVAGIEIWSKDDLTTKAVGSCCDSIRHYAIECR